MTPESVRDFVRPAVRAVPRALAIRLGHCEIAFPASLEDPSICSRWTRTGAVTEIAVAAGRVDPHEAAIELLLCLGEALWERLIPEERALYLRLLGEEIARGVEGEIDDSALEEKTLLLSNPLAARGEGALEHYARTSFTGTLAEYVHSLWHDVEVRTGPEHLPALDLRRRLELLACLFPPNPGYRLFGKKRGTLPRAAAPNDRPQRREPSDE